MTILIINVGNTEYSKHSLPIIKKLCEHNKIKMHVLSSDIPQNIYHKHPSWLKLFCHDLIDDDFILCWDLDLLPIKKFKLDFLDFSKINLCHDRCFIQENFTFNGKFKYNCGLLGIPKQFKDFFKSIYFDKAKNSTYPSYEQYHVNDRIYDEKIDINLMDIKYNYLYDKNEIPSSVFNIHYTWKIDSNQHRIKLIENHFNKFYENF